MPPTATDDKAEGKAAEVKRENPRIAIFVQWPLIKSPIESQT